MARRQHIAAARSQYADVLPHLGAHFLHRAEWQGVLVVHRAVQDDAAGILLLEHGAIHALGAPLDRVEQVDPQFHQFRQDAGDVPVIVMEYVLTRGMRQVDHALHAGEKIRADVARRHEQVDLLAGDGSGGGHDSNDCTGFQKKRKIWMHGTFSLIPRELRPPTTPPNPFHLRNFLVLILARILAV